MLRASNGPLGNEILSQFDSSCRLDAVNVRPSAHVVGRMPTILAVNRSRRMLRCDIAHPLLAGLLLLIALAFVAPVPARADDDMPPRIGRVAEVGGELFLAPQDAPDQWVAIGLNYPVATGDNLWVGNEGRAEIDFGGGQFRLGGATSLHLSRLDERNFALYVAQGRVIVRVRMLDPGEVARIDTPNSQITLTRPGLYRVEVAEDRQQTQLAVREGEAIIDTGSTVQQVLPGQSASLDGPAPPYAQLRNGVATDGFDTWSANRDRRYERNRANSPVSRQMVGYADLDEYGAWETAPEYGAVWYPANVGEDWAPYRNGYWTDVGAWGPTWVDAAPWGYAPFHYGRWAHIRGRWGWCPGGYVARPVWAPALVGWVGGPGWRFSSNFGAPVYGWVPLGWGEAYHPHWKGCSDGCWARYNKPYAVNTAMRPDVPPAHYANASMPGAVTAVPGAAFVGRKPVASNLVAISGAAAVSAPVLAAPMIRPEIRQAPGIKPGNGVPRPASTSYAATNAQGRTIAPVDAVPSQRIAVPLPPVARTPAAVPAAVNSAVGMPPPTAKPLQAVTSPQVGADLPPVQRPPAAMVSPPAPGAIPPTGVEAKNRTQSLPQPVAVSPNAATTSPASQGGAGTKLAPIPMREMRPVPTLPAPTASAPTTLAVPPPMHQAPVVPASHAVPGAPVAVAPGGHPVENPKLDKSAAPVVHAPADVPAK